MAAPRVCTFISGRTFISGLVLTLLAVGLTASQLPWRPALLPQTYSTC
jgi:hypothetical protein